MFYPYKSDLLIQTFTNYLNSKNFTEIKIINKKTTICGMIKSPIIFENFTQEKTQYYSYKYYYEYIKDAEEVMYIYFLNDLNDIIFTLTMNVEIDKLKLYNNELDEPVCKFYGYNSVDDLYNILDCMLLIMSKYNSKDKISEN